MSVFDAVASVQSWLWSHSLGWLLKLVFASWFCAHRLDEELKMAKAELEQLKGGNAATERSVNASMPKMLGLSVLCVSWVLTMQFYKAAELGYPAVVQSCAD